MRRPVLAVKYLNHHKKKVSAAGSFTFVSLETRLHLLVNPFSTGQNSYLKVLRSCFYVQWECVNSAFTLWSIDAAVDAGFFHVGSALI